MEGEEAENRGRRKREQMRGTWEDRRLLWWC